MLETRGQFRLEGVEELDQLLRKLPQKVGDKVMAGAVRAGANVIRKAASDLAPVRAEETLRRINPAKKTGEFRLPGFLKRNIIVQRIKAPDRKTVRFLIGPIREAYYGMFVEFGTRFMSAQPFLRPAFDREKRNAVTKMGQHLGRSVLREARKLAGPLAKSGLLGRRR